MEPDLVSKIRADLLAGRFRPGEWLRLNDLEQRYGATRFEVRKSLATLTTLNALEHVENYGYRVLKSDPQRDAHQREVRLAIELAAAPKVIAAARPADIKKLLLMAQQFEWAVENAPIAEIAVSNNNFHRAFVALCGNPVMADIINDLRENTLSFSRDPFETLADRRKSAREHFELIEHLQNKDVEKLRAVITSHLYRPPFSDAEMRQFFSGATEADDETQQPDTI